MNNNKTLKLNYFTILTIVFIILKLCKVITWNWFWVLSPMIIPILIGIGIVIIVAIIKSL